jgi:hypothetical protein
MGRQPSFLGVQERAAENVRLGRHCSKAPEFVVDKADPPLHTAAPNPFPWEPAMYAPGRYIPDPTEGMVNVKDLPAPQREFAHSTRFRGKASTPSRILLQ